MTNRHRGEVKLEIGGEVFTLRLTLQALAEIEAALGAGDLQGLGERFAQGRVGARDLVALIGAAARGGGSKLSDSAIAEKMGAEDLPGAVVALGELFALSFGAEDSTRPRTP
ncbi:MAG: gene transfer agent family protein [Rhabdaerophilum sp.]